MLKSSTLTELITQTRHALVKLLKAKTVDFLLMDKKFIQNYK